MCGVHKIIHEDKTSNHAFEEQRNKQSNSKNKDIIVAYPTEFKHLNALYNVSFLVLGFIGCFRHI